MLRERIILLYSTYITDLFVDKNSEDGFKTMIDLIVRSVSIKKEKCYTTVFIQGCQTLSETLKYVKSDTCPQNIKEIMISIYPKLFALLSEPLSWVNKPIFFKMIQKFIKFGSNFLNENTNDNNLDMFSIFFNNLSIRLNQALTEHVTALKDKSYYRGDFEILEQLIRILSNLCSINKLVKAFGGIWESFLTTFCVLFEE